MAAQQNGKSALEYVHQDMLEAAVSLKDADKALASAAMPNFTVCPASGEAYHKAMATSAHANGQGLSTLLQWASIQVERDIQRENGSLQTRQTDPGSSVSLKFGKFGGQFKGPAAIHALLLVVVLLGMGYMYFDMRAANAERSKMDTQLKQLLQGQVAR